MVGEDAAQLDDRRVGLTEIVQGHGENEPGALVGLVFLVELILVLGAWTTGPSVAGAIRGSIPPAATVTNTEAIGRVLYTTYAHFFELAGIILLVAMIGAIVLTLRHKVYVRRQNISVQVGRANEIDVRKVQSGQGI